MPAKQPMSPRSTHLRHSMQTVSGSDLAGVSFPYRSAGMDAQLTLEVQVDVPAEDSAHQRFRDSVTKCPFFGRFVTQASSDHTCQVHVSLWTVEEALSQLLRVQAIATLLFGHKCQLRHNGTISTVQTSQREGVLTRSYANCSVCYHHWPGWSIHCAASTDVGNKSGQQSSARSSDGQPSRTLSSDGN